MTEKSQHIVLCQVMTNPNLSGCCGLAVTTFCSFISHLIGCKIDVQEIFCGVYGFTGNTAVIINKHLTNAEIEIGNQYILIFMGRVDFKFQYVKFPFHQCSKRF